MDADIRSFFQEVSQEWAVRFLEHRIGDKRMIRLIQKWFRAGILEDGIVTIEERGTGQGSVISPLIANIYLHYVFDLWANRWRQREATGNMIIVRFSDDRVPRTHLRKEVRCCARDGGRSSGAGRQGQAPNHRKLRRFTDMLENQQAQDHFGWRPAPTATAALGMSLAQGLINGCDDGLVVQDPVGILHPIFAKIIHLFGDQPVAKAALCPAHLNHGFSSAFLSSTLANLDNAEESAFAG